MYDIKVWEIVRRILECRLRKFLNDESDWVFGVGWCPKLINYPIFAGFVHSLLESFENDLYFSSKCHSDCFDFSSAWSDCIFSHVLTLATKKGLWIGLGYLKINFFLYNSETFLKEMIPAFPKLLVKVLENLIGIGNDENKFSIFTDVYDIFILNLLKFFHCKKTRKSSF